jgi:hypothetical protein
VEFVFAALFVLYLAPWIVSEWRQRDDSAAILAVNLVAGWTVLGWLGALWWAGGDGRPQRAAARARLRLVQPPPHGSPEAWPDALPAASSEAPPHASARRPGSWAAALLAAAALAAGALRLVPGAPPVATERVGVAELALREAPRSGAAVVARLPRGCVAAVTERRGEWRRLWRTSDCPASARGRAAGWVRGSTSQPLLR